LGDDKPGSAAYNARMGRNFVRAVSDAATPAMGAAAVALFGLSLLAARAGAVPPSPAGNGTGKELVVALVESPPFAVKGDDGTWSGLSVDLWREVAGQLDLDWQPREATLEEVPALLRDGSADVALGAIAVDVDGEIQHDYSQPYYSTGLGFAERAKDELSWRRMTAVVANSDVLHLIAVIGAAIIAVGVLITFIERRRDASEFGGPLRRGIATGVWWAAVTMTTVGYGDATPKTASGRSLALIWMFIGVVVLAFFTATVTSILTLASLRGTVQHATELAHVRTGTVAGSPGALYLNRRNVAFTHFTTYEDSLEALAEGRVDAVVATAPALRHLVRHQWQGVIRVSPIVLEPLRYTIGLAPDSRWQEAINRALLRIVGEDRWRDVEQGYFGHT
jgi:ABC-type amino acid transport substrate-binding protein